MNTVRNSPNLPVMDPVLVRKYDGPGPRYTSYPTADRFTVEHDAHSHRAVLAQRHPATPLSIYIHIPFCSTICYYCGCNKVVTKDHGRSAKYLRYLEREFALVAAAIKGPRRVAQVHLGGGTPTFLSADELQELMTGLDRHFELLPGEYAIEIDPRTVDAAKIAALARLGFNRMSLGVQDFDPSVQVAVNRVQSLEVTEQAIVAARAHGVTSINIDLIYGLPRQTVNGFDRTLEQVVALRPDRIALYSYAHLPALFKPQRRIATEELPDGESKLAILTLAIRKLTDAGYLYIGMDHFALPHDELAIAAAGKELHRNFQGYSTRPESDLLAFGISAISKVGASYSQNIKTLDEYYDCLDKGELPVMRGIALTPDDLLRRDVINAVMCDFRVSIQAVENAHGVNFGEYFTDAWPQLDALAADKLIEIAPNEISVTKHGRLLVRNVAMAFDRNLAKGARQGNFSKRSDRFRTSAPDVEVLSG